MISFLVALQFDFHLNGQKSVTVEPGPALTILCIPGHFQMSAVFPSPYITNNEWMDANHILFSSFLANVC